MLHFPTSHSILADFPLCEFLILKYNFSENSSCQLIKSWVNDTYLIQDGNQKYIFRVYRFNWRSQLEIEAELNFINFLKEKNISVSYPILDASNNWIQTFQAPEGERYGVLFSYAEGEKRMTLNPKIHFNIGEIIAKIHKNSLGLQGNRIHYTLDILLKDSFRKISRFLSEEDSELMFLKKTKQYIYNYFKKADHSSFRKGMVHLDIWADNIHIDKDDNFTIFDFDFCGNGWLVLDFAYHLVMLFITTSDKEIYEHKAAEFKKGYQNVTQLHEVELQSYPHIGATLLFYYLGFQCKRFKAVFVNEDYVKGFINSRIKTWWQYHNSP